MQMPCEDSGAVEKVGVVVAIRHHGAGRPRILLGKDHGSVFVQEDSPTARPP